MAGISLIKLLCYNQPTNQSTNEANLSLFQTRILVTHGITFLPEVDLIVVLKDGTVSETGTYKELLAKKGAFADFLLQHLQEESTEDGAAEGNLLYTKETDRLDYSINILHYTCFSFRFG